MQNGNIMLRRSHAKGCTGETRKKKDCDCPPMYWQLRYREPVLVNGKITTRPASHKLADYSREFNTAESVQPLAQLILAPINAKIATPQTVLTLADFLAHVYLPFVKENMKPSTFYGYKVVWKLVEPHLDGAELRSFRPKDVDALLRAIAAEKLRAHTTHRNVRNFLSGAFRYARRQELYHGDNPVRDALVPRGLPAGDTPAYTLEELVAMLKVLPEPIRTAVLVAGLTGLRVSEIKGLQWADFTGDALNIQRGVWQGKVSDTKTLRSRAAVPVVAPVREALLAHRQRTPGNDYIFRGGTGKPLRLENELRRTAKPLLTKAGIQWRGWHGFRRGVGTILNQLGVDDITIQAILRHASVQTTQAFYVKPLTAESIKAMKKLAAAFKASAKK